MKATGIVRRIDDLGRVVIPKEIRRTLRIREGDPLEIYTATDGEVIFKAVPTLISKDGAKSVDINGKTTDGGVIKITGAANDVFSCILIFAAAASVMAFGIFVAVRKLR